MPSSFADRLTEAVRSKGSSLVVGLDPRLEQIPAAIRAAAADIADPRERAAETIRRFNAEIIELVAPHAVAVKPQVAFYERWGAPGVAAYEDAIMAARAADLLVIGDVKRADIGSTAAAYAEAHLGSGDTAADAVTVNPYLGTDGVQPFIDVAARESGGVFVLVRTSNPSAGELQDLPSRGMPLHEHVAELVTRWGRGVMGACGYSSVGAVVGATAPAELARLRALMPQAWLLVPGVGAQGAGPEDVAAAFDANGLGAVVNSSRGVIHAYADPRDPSWREAVRSAARDLRDRLLEVAGLRAAT